MELECRVSHQITPPADGSRLCKICVKVYGFIVKDWKPIFKPSSIANDSMVAINNM